MHEIANDKFVVFFLMGLMKLDWFVIYTKIISMNDITNDEFSVFFPMGLSNITRPITNKYLMICGVHDVNKFVGIQPHAHIFGKASCHQFQRPFLQNELLYLKIHSC